MFLLTMLYPKVKIVVSRNHWQCVSCRFVSKHTFSIEQHLQTQHRNLLFPVANISTFNCDYGSYSDGELDVVSAFGLLKQKNVLRDSSSEVSAGSSPDYQHKRKTGKRTSKKEKNKNVATKKNNIKNVENQREATRHSVKCQQLSPPLQTRRTTRAVSKLLSQPNSRQTGNSCYDTETKEDLVKQKVKPQPGESAPKNSEGHRSSSPLDFDNDSDYEPLHSLVKKFRKKKHSHGKSDIVGEQLPEKESLDTKVLSGQSRKLSDEGLHDTKENPRRQDTTKPREERKEKRMRRQPDKSQLQPPKDNCDGRGKRPGLGGKPVKRTLSVSGEEKEELKDCYIGMCEDKGNSAGMTVHSLSVTPLAPLPSNCEATCIEVTSEEQVTDDFIPENKLENSDSVHVEKTNHTLKHVPVPLIANEKETGPLAAIESKFDPQPAEENCPEYFTSESHRCLVSSEPLAKDACRLEALTSESRCDVLSVDHSTGSEAVSHVTEVNTTVTQEHEDNTSHLRIHHTDDFQQHFPQPEINKGYPSLHSGFVSSGSRLRDIKDHQHLSTFPSGLQVSSLSQEAHSSSTAEHIDQFCGDTDVLHVNSSSFESGILHSQADASCSQSPVTHKTTVPNDTLDTAESVEWLKSRTNFHFSSTKHPMVASIKQPSQIFECSVCLAKFSSADNLSHHVSKMSTYSLSHCKGCGRTFHNVYDLSLHVFSEHERKKKPFCFECGENFQTMEAFEQHLHRHLWAQDLKLLDLQFHACRICQEDVLCKYAIMRKHYYNKHKMSTCLECLVCSNLVLLSDTTSAKEHRQTHINFCNVCVQDLPTAEALEAHHLHHKNTPYAAEEDGAGDVCERCKRWCPNKASVMLHQREHKLQVMRDWRVEKWGVNMSCPHCEKVLRNKRNLQRHIDQQHATGGRSYKFHCEFCGKGLDSKSALKDHIALHHLGIKRYVCEFCHQRFTNTPTLRRHVLRDHATDKQYICEFCGKRFCEKFNMKKHMYTHTGASRFMCEQCGKAFHSSSEFKKHMSVHVEKRDYVCQGCWQGYKRKEHLKRHISKCPKAVQSSGAQASSTFLLYV